jgi:hypothetical protein
MAELDPHPSAPHVLARQIQTRLGACLVPGGLAALSIHCSMAPRQLIAPHPDLVRRRVVQNYAALPRASRSPSSHPDGQAPVSSDETQGGQRYADHPDRTNPRSVRSRK